jgi:hypothetical protein
VHDDEKFDEFLRHAASDYHAPVPPPADAIWAAIEQDVATAIAPVQRSAAHRFRPVMWIGVGVAATLMLGVAVGRWTALRPVPATPPAVAATNGGSTASDVHARAVTMEHLAEAEVFLTSVRAELKAGRSDDERAERSRDLLVRTRVLLGSSADRSPEVARLLEDLELLLAEIAALPAKRGSLDKTLLDESMRDGNIIPRIRATLPVRPAGA